MRCNITICVPSLKSQLVTQLINKFKERGGQQESFNLPAGSTQGDAQDQDTDLADGASDDEDQLGEQDSGVADYQAVEEFAEEDTEAEQGQANGFQIEDELERIMDLYDPTGRYAKEPEGAEEAEKTEAEEAEEEKVADAETQPADVTLPTPGENNNLFVSAKDEQKAEECLKELEETETQQHTSQAVAQETPIDFPKPVIEDDGDDDVAMLTPVRKFETPEKWF